MHARQEVACKRSCQGRLIGAHEFLGFRLALALGSERGEKEKGTKSMLGITRSSTGFISHLALAGIGWRVAEGEERGSGIRRWRVRAKEDWKEQDREYTRGLWCAVGTARCVLGGVVRGWEVRWGGTGFPRVEPGMTGGVNGGLLQDAETEHRTVLDTTAQADTGRITERWIDGGVEGVR